MEDIIVNKVSSSGLISLDLEAFYPEGNRVLYDMKDNLFMGLILKEKDFRTFLKEHDWSQYQNKHIAIFCSEDAIIPTWAYMLLAGHFSEVASTVIFGDAQNLEIKLFENLFDKMDFEKYRNQRVVVKGCGEKDIPAAVYVELTRRLKPIVKSLMFGEPCSTVPLFKNKN